MARVCPDCLMPLVPNECICDDDEQDQSPQADPDDAA